MIHHTSGTVFTSDQLSQQLNERMKLITAGDKFPNSISTGYIKLDELLGGFQNGNLYSVGASQGMGKTAFMMNLVHNIILSESSQANVVIYTPNLSARDLMNRLVSNTSGISFEKITKGDLLSSECARIVQFLNGKLASSPLIIDENPVLNILYLEAQLSKLKEEKKLEIVFIDYLQLMKPEKGRSGEDEMAFIMRGLKRLAQKFFVPVIVMSEFNHSVKNIIENDKKAYCYELKDLNSIEQEADVALVIHRPEFCELPVNDFEEYNFGETFLRITRNRLGSLDTIKFIAELEIQRFTEGDSLFFEIKDKAGKRSKHFYLESNEYQKQIYSDDEERTL